MRNFSSHSTLCLVMSLTANLALANAATLDETKPGHIKVTTVFNYATKSKMHSKTIQQTGSMKINTTFNYATNKKTPQPENHSLGHLELSTALNYATDDTKKTVSTDDILMTSSQDEVNPFTTEATSTNTVVAAADTYNEFGIRENGFSLSSDQSLNQEPSGPWAYQEPTEEIIVAEVDRRRPGAERKPDRPAPKQEDPNRNTDLRPIAISNPNLPHPVVPVPDRYRIVEAIGVNERWFDPYNQNTLKGDRPILGTKDWFFSANIISDTVYEPRKLPTPVSPATSRSPGALDVFGGRDQTVFSQTLITGFVLYKGDTAFKPPDHEFRLTLAFNYNRVEVEEDRVLSVLPGRGNVRRDTHVGVQELFWDKHLRNVSDRYDFDSIRVGIQPFNTDFRGFLFQDQQFGIRLFGNRDNNFYQYNLAWFRRVDKDLNSGLNDISKSLRDDDVFIANIYKQDFPVIGYTSQATVIHNRNREGDDGLFFDSNGFLARPAPLGDGRPRNYNVTYIGYNGDGHFGRVNLTTSYYYATGNESRNAFFNGKTRIDAFFLAAEASMDFDWIRVRLSGLYASGDKDPFDNVSQGFDAIFENPQFAGSDTSFWIRQPVANIGGGGVALSARNGILNSLRTSKEQGQSNFVNPGTTLIGVGADFDITPEWRVSVNANKLGFANTASLEAYRQVGSIDNDIGWDLSVSAIYRPFFTQNVIFRLSAAALEPGDGFKELYGDETSYSILANLLLTY